MRHEVSSRCDSALAGAAPFVGGGGCAKRGLVFNHAQTYRSPMNTLAIEAEVDSQGWLNIHTPAPPGTLPGKLDVVVVWSPPKAIADERIHPRAGTLPGKVELAADFHAPLDEFRAYSD
jgi:hypothetical protein